MFWFQLRIGRENQNYISFSGCRFNSDSYKTIEECQANCITPETTSSPLVRYIGKKTECSLSTKVHTEISHEMVLIFLRLCLSFLFVFHANTTEKCPMLFEESFWSNFDLSRLETAAVVWKGFIMMIDQVSAVLSSTLDAKATGIILWVKTPVFRHACLKQEQKLP